MHRKRKKAGLLWSEKLPDIPGSNEPPGRAISSGYKKLLYEYPIYRNYARKTPNADFVRNNAVWFDLHRWSEEEWIKKNLSIVNQVYNDLENKV